MHWHTNEEEWQFVLNGTVEVGHAQNFSIASYAQLALQKQFLVFAEC